MCKCRGCRGLVPPARRQADRRNTDAHSREQATLSAWHGQQNHHLSHSKPHAAAAAATCPSPSGPGESVGSRSPCHRVPLSNTTGSHFWRASRRVVKQLDKISKKCLKMRLHEGQFLRLTPGFRLLQLFQQLHCRRTTRKNQKPDSMKDRAAFLLRSSSSPKAEEEDFPPLSAAARLHVLYT